MSAANPSRPARFSCISPAVLNAAIPGRMGRALLPDDVALLRETRDLILRRHALSLNRGNAALPQLKAIDARPAAIREEAADARSRVAEAALVRGRIAERVLRLRDIKSAAVGALRAAMA